MRSRHSGTGTAKVAVSLPSDVYRDLGERDRAARIRRYVEGYAVRPEGEEEVAAAEAAAARLLAREPWE